MRRGENTQRSGYPQLPPLRLGPSICVVDQQTMCLERDRQADGRPLARIERVKTCIWWGIRRDVEPRRRILNPCANLRWSSWLLHFGRDRFRHYHSGVKRFEDACRSNPYQIIEWAGIGNDYHS